MSTSHIRIPEEDIVLLIRIPHVSGSLGHLLSVIGDEGGLIGNIETQFIGRENSVRAITLSVYDQDHLKRIQETIKEQTEAEVLEVKDLVFERHEGGKIHSGRTHELERVDDLRYIYTPGVARVCRAIQEQPDLARRYTSIGNSVGIFTNGTRVLGLGDIGPLASLPVMEGKAVLYDRFVGLSATPILVDTKDPEEFIQTVEKIAPSFGGIHLEDISNPECYHIEDELNRRLSQPVMHDDQHGTATVLLAAVLSALRETGRSDDPSLVCAQIGLGAAGFGIARLLLDYGFQVIGSDPQPDSQQRLIDYGGTVVELAEAMQTADVVVATTGVVGLIKPTMIRPGQIIFAISNPVPEIIPEEAIQAGASFAADGKSVNNALAFPGLFKAALAVQSTEISSTMKIAAAKAISALADQGEVVPSVFHPDVHEHVIQAVLKLFE
ncbi:MAG: NAD-dependent malic enzyme [Gemmatimonadota bacterium]|nr:NAD-dependent malic enzyme [Gemmatimonadota bacterium]